jgi:uncharacterized membrane protein SpoIIM required for sporulation
MHAFIDSRKQTAGWQEPLSQNYGRSTTMSLKQWFAAEETHWSRLETLLLKTRRNPASSLSPDEIREIALLYQRAVNALSRARSSSEFSHLEPYLNNLVQRCHGQVYGRPPAKLQNILAFFRRDFPVTFRKYFHFVLLAFAMFALGAVIAMLTVHLNPETERYFLPGTVIDQLDHGVLWTDHASAAPSESSFLMTNNIRVAVNAFALGIVFGVGTLVLLLHNGMFAFGGPMQITWEHHMGHRLLTFIMAHGVIELTTIFIAGAAGMIIGFALLFPGELPRWQAVRRKTQDALILIMGCIPMLILAGLIEGLISLNRSVGIFPRAVVTGLSAAFLITYLGFSGREKSASPQADTAQAATTSTTL